MLRSEDERERVQTATPVKVYCDKRLVGSRRVYGRFVRRLAMLGLTTFTQQPREHVGIFFVWKKGRERMRMILDCRRSNQAFVDPPGVSLLTAEGLANIEIVGDAVDGTKIHLGGADIKDCFHRYRLNRKISVWFCLPPGTAKEFGISGTVLDGVLLNDESQVWPAAAVLPMGWNWSVYYSESAGLEQLSHVSQLDASKLATDRTVPMRLGECEADMWHWLYIDNFGVLGLNRETVKEAL